MYLFLFYYKIYIKTNHFTAVFKVCGQSDVLFKICLLFETNCNLQLKEKKARLFFSLKFLLARLLCEL